MENDAQFANEVKEMTYDPLYRLLSATGTEKGLWQDSIPWKEWDMMAPNNVIRNYTEQYEYNKVGFMTKLRHLDNGGSYQYTRNFAAVSGTNRLESLTAGSNTFGYEYDATGNLIQSHGNRYYLWDNMGRLQRYTTSAGLNTADSTVAIYLYDAGGNRLKKYVINPNIGIMDVTLYCGNIEVRYKAQHVSGFIIGYQNCTVTANLKANGENILTVQNGNHPDEWNESYFTFSDHLGTGTVTMGYNGDILSCDLHTPFGETSYTNRPRSRHRYCGKEKDAESGLYYYGARYYESWTCRFVSVDPLAEKYAQLSRA